MPVQIATSAPDGFPIVALLQNEYVALLLIIVLAIAFVLLYVNYQNQ